MLTVSVRGEEVSDSGFLLKNGPKSWPPKNSHGSVELPPMSEGTLASIDAAGNFIDKQMSLMTRSLVALAPVAVPSLRAPGLPVPVGTGRPPLSLHHP